MTIILNTCLAVGLVAALIVLLSHFGVRKDREHRGHMFRARGHSVSPR